MHASSLETRDKWVKIVSLTSWALLVVCICTSIVLVMTCIVDISEWENSDLNILFEGSIFAKGKSRFWLIIGELLGDILNIVQAILAIKASKRENASAVKELIKFVIIFVVIRVLIYVTQFLVL